MTESSSRRADDTSKGRLASRIDSGELVITSELTPPKGIDLAPLLAKANECGPRVDAFNLTDSHNARMSMTPLAAAHLLMDHGVEPTVQLTTRDRNRIALQSDMLGAAALGIPNVVLMGGDDPKAGDHPEAKPVFDIGTEDLIRAAGALNNGTDLMGNALNAAPALTIGAVVNPGSSDLDKEIARLGDKAAAGATFFQTQAIYDRAGFEGFLERVAKENLAPGAVFLAGIIPIKSVRMATYMNENVPGVDVPDWLIAMINDADDVEAVNVEVLGQLMEDLAPYCGGFHLMAIGWERLIPTLLERARLSEPGGR